MGCGGDNINSQRERMLNTTVKNHLITRNHHYGESTTAKTALSDHEKLITYLCNSIFLRLQPPLIVKYIVSCESSLFLTVSYERMWVSFIGSNIKVSL